jgi:sugar phosphate isomerase/epimerase
MREFVQESQAWGFEGIELSPVLSAERLAELLSSGEISISSVHSPCPNMLSSRDVPSSRLSLSALEDEVWGEAVGFARSTIDLASSVGARVVVIHLGWVELDRTLEDRLRSLYEAGLTSSQEYREVQAHLVSERGAKVGPYFEAARKSLRELCEYASRKDVLLGLECRVSFHEIPALEEMVVLLEEFVDGPLGYWHDVGHAEIQSRLGFTPHDDWFSRLGDRMIGVHLHDVLGVSDHHPPGKGNLDWGSVAARLPVEAMRVCEIGEWNKPEDARQAVPFLQAQGVIK